MEDWDFHALAQFGFDLEALWRLDVFQVDAAEGRLQRGDDVDQLLGVPFVDFDVEDIDVGELLEQDALAFHHRLGRQRADRTQPQHGGAVGDDRDQVTAGGNGGGRVRIGDDRFARRRYPGRIGQGQIALVGKRLRRRDLYFSRGIVAVILKRGRAKIFG